MKIQNLVTSFVTAAVSLSSTSSFAVEAKPGAQQIARPPQFILLSFDGSKSIPFWKETKAFSARHNVGFTYFISGVYFLAGDDRQIYQPPNRKRGRSDIGFSNSHAEILTRVDEVMGASRQNLEIGSHANGHFDGSSWSFSDWISELSQFREFLKDVFSINRFRRDFESEWNDKVVEGVKGIRAPLLGVNKDYYKSLKESGYNYDTSGIGSSSRWPYKDSNGLWMFPLQSIRMAGTGKKTVTMDYNLMVAQCNNQFADSGETRCKGATAEKLKGFEDETYNTYMNLFKQNYSSNRAPIVIGHHFALWNDGIYWKAMQRFAADVCKQEEVRCVTYGEMINWIAAQQSGNSEILADYQKAKFPPMPEKAMKLSSTTMNSLQVDANIVKDQNGAFVAKLSGRDAQALKSQNSLQYEWKVDGIQYLTTEKAGNLNLSGAENLNGKTISLTVKNQGKEIVVSDKIIRSNGEEDSVWLENSEWQERVLKGDLPEAHREEINEELLIQSRIR